MSNTTLFIRNIDQETADLIKQAAKARGFTLAQYLERAVSLHQAVRSKALGASDAELYTMLLNDAGLEIVIN
jgi:hypothetical protein